MNESFYFETSAVNALYHKFSSDDRFSSVETKKFQISKGRKWYISSAVLWEIFRTKDKNRRYYLFDFCRCLFYGHLITCPEELIVNYIKSGCPVFEKPYNLDSSNKGLFAKEWQCACDDARYYFEPDIDQLHSYSYAMQFLWKYLHKKQNGYELKGEKELLDHSYHLLGIRFESLLDKLVQEFGGLTDMTDEKKQYVFIVFHVALVILCYGITLNKEIIEDYWNSKNISKPISRMEWLVENSIPIFFRGPLSNIAKMTVLQSNSKYSRGLHIDSLHSVYFTCIDMYFTSDDHFIDFKNKIPDPNMLKIMNIADVEFGVPLLT